MEPAGRAAAVTFSFEVVDRAEAPPFADGCPRCVSGELLVPYATNTEGAEVVAFYRHRRCGYQWLCRWGARWSIGWRAA